MSPVVHGLFEGAAVCETPAGYIERIPLAWVSAIDNAVQAGDVVELDGCSYTTRWSSCDQPALTTTETGKPVCFGHYDDEPKEH